MKTQKSGKKQGLSIHQRIRKNRGAAFVPIESQKNKNFKSSVNYRLYEQLVKSFKKLKLYYAKTKGKIRLLSNEVDWPQLKYETIIWMFEAGIEGFGANFVMHYLLGAKFNLFTMMAYGNAIKQGISVYWRLRKNGPTNKILKKN